jgi:hypothetical protein
MVEDCASFYSTMQKVDSQWTFLARNNQIRNCVFIHASGIWPAWQDVGCILSEDADHPADKWPGQQLSDQPG